MGLTIQQREAVEHDGNILLTACPGSGKTRTLIAKAVREIEAIRNSPRRICCITYTNSAAQEIEQRASLELQENDNLHLLVSTIHAFCLQEILRPYGWLLPNFNGVVKVLTRDNPDFEQIATYAAAQIGLHNLNHNDYEAFESLSVNSAGEFVGLVTRNEPVRRAAPFFWARNAERGYVDFGAIIYNSYLILRDHPRVARSLCSRFSWLMVDEFQDTTELQLDLLRLLFSAGGAKFFLVGDLTQSIYGFTGARPELIEPFGHAIGARTNLSLSHNYRSSAHIVAHAERLFPREPAMQAAGRYRDFNQQPVLVQGLSTFETITERFLPLLVDHNIGLGDATILAKDWASLIRLSRELRDFGTPVVGPGARPYRRSRLFATLAEQLCGAVVEPLSDTMHQLQRAVFLAVQDITGQPRFDVFSHEGRVLVIRLLRAASLHAQAGGALNWLDSMSIETGQLFFDAGLINAVQLGLFYASVQEMKADMVRQNVDTTNLSIEDLGIFASPTRALRLSTIHYAKGREYAAVAMIGLREGSFPHIRATSPAELLSEKRLFYVGLTRAEKILMYVADRDRWNNPPSPFLRQDGLHLA